MVCTCTTIADWVENTTLGCTVWDVPVDDIAGRDNSVSNLFRGSLGSALLLDASRCSCTLLLPFRTFTVTLRALRYDEKSGSTN